MFSSRDNIIGIGGEGIVVKKQDIARKILTKNRQYLLYEHSIIQGLCHPNIVKCIGINVDKNTIDYEFIDGRTLKEILDTSSLDTNDILKILFGILSGVSYLHSMGVVHGDLKPANIMIEKQTNRVVLIDFGCSSRVNSTGSFMNTFSGTVIYSAPELLSKKQPPTMESDIYSFGIILWQLLTQKQPYDGISNLDIIRIKTNYMSFRDNWRGHLPEFKTQGKKTILWDTVYDCLQDDPSDRPTHLAIIRRLQKNCL